MTGPTKKFKKGDIVYYTNAKNFLPHDKPFEVDAYNEAEGPSGPSVHLKGDHPISFYGAQAFISEDEYKKRNPVKFKRGEKIYFIGGDISSYSEKIRNEMKPDTPYEVVDMLPPDIIKYPRVQIYVPDPEIIGGNGRVTLFPADYFLSEKEYNIYKKGRSKGKGDTVYKFKAGDIVHYDGPKDIQFDRDLPFRLWADTNPEVFSINHKGEWTPVLKSFIEQYFISDEEYRQVGSTVAKSATNKPKFSKDDIVYYNGPSDYKKGDYNKYCENKLKKDTPYKVDGYKEGIYKLALRIEGNTLRFVPDDFMTEKEYKDKNKGKSEFSWDIGSIRNPAFKKSVDSKFEPTVGNYDSFIKKFRAGDTIYYVGDKIPKLKKDTPYKVKFYNPSTGLIQLNDATCPDTDFISEKDYERLKLLNDSTNKKGEKGEKKNEVELKMNIYRDTKENKIVWTQPYSTHDEWFRSNIYLKDPPKSYLRIDVKREEDKWNLYIYFHRSKNPISGLGGDKPIQILHFEESQILKAIAIKIQDQIENVPLFAQEDSSTWD